MKRFMSLLVLVSSCVMAAQAGFTLVESGKARCSIAVPQNADGVTRLAAEELQLWCREITGAQLEIVDDGTTGAAVSLELTDAIAELKGNDGYATRVDGGKFHLLASCPKGLLNGVFRTLYKNTDIIWARPDAAIGTVFTKAAELSFDAAPVTDVPVYRMRGWQLECGKERPENSAWLARNCANRMTNQKYIRKYGCYEGFGTGHNLCSLYLPEKIYYKDHPDFYPLVDGRRVRPSEMPYSCQLCFTNDDMTKEFIARLDKIVTENPQYSMYGVMIEDNYVLCTCDKCMAPIHLPDGTVLDGRGLKVQSREWKVWRSTQFFIWLEKLSAFMKAKHPDKILRAFAYFFTEYPPKVKVADNVSISYCPIYRDSKYTAADPHNKIVLDMVDGWLSQARHVCWREYYGLNVEYPRPIDRMAFFDLAYLSKKGLDDSFSEITPDAVQNVIGRRNGTHVWDVGAPFLWSLVQAPWNPNRNVEDVRREFYTRVFGAAAKEVEAFYDLIDKAWYANPKKSVYNDRAKMLWILCFRLAGIQDACNRHLEAALKAVDKPNGKAMLERLKAYVESATTVTPADAIVIPKATGKVEFVPGFGTDVWKGALQKTEFWHENGTPAKYPTTMYFLHDGEFLYAAMHAERKGIATMLDSTKNYCQTEVFNLFVQIDEQPYPDYFNIMVDPLNVIWASARDSRKIPGFEFTRQVHLDQDRWDCMIAVPLKQLPPTRRIAAFRRYNDHDRPGEWPNAGVGFKNASLFDIFSYATFELGK